jgi:hypothetical protein
MWLGQMTFEALHFALTRHDQTQNLYAARRLKTFRGPVALPKIRQFVL